MDLPDSAFYVSQGGGFVSSPLTRGPWDPGSQHAGPPTALLARELERCPTPIKHPDGSPRWRFARLTMEILRPVPIAPLEVEVEVERPGRTVELLAGSLADERGPVIRARAWRIAGAAVRLPAVPTAPPAGAPPPPRAGEEEVLATGHEVGYHAAMAYRFVAGSFVDPGPATVWMRPRVALVAGEQPTPLQRVLLVADSGNGVSAALDWSRYLFVNVDLSVHLYRMPAGEWLCLDAVTTVEPDGIGLTETALHDERGPIGRALQSLVVRERDA